MKKSVAILYATMIGVTPVVAQESTDSMGPSRASLLAGPPVRRIESAQSISTIPLGAITSVRALPNGQVLVNDGTRRRLIMFDSTLTNVTVVLDSLAEVANAYGTRPGTLLPFIGDSSVFIDPATYAMLILDAAGRITRVRAVPRALDISYITSASFAYGVPGFDSRARFVYRTPAKAAPPVVAPPQGMPYIPIPPDSAFVVAVNLDTRLPDTIGVVRIPKIVYSFRLEPEGYFNINQIPNPLPLTDDWAVLSTGAVAFVRGVDYRVEFRAPDGTITSSEKLSFPWVPMSDSAKEVYSDSVKTLLITNAQTNFTTQMIAWSNLLNKPYPASFVPAEKYVLPPGLPTGWILPKGVTYPANYVPACPPGVAPTVSVPMPFGNPLAPPPTANSAATPPVAGAPPACAQSFFGEMYGQGYTPPAPIYRAPTLVRPRDLPDFRPPFLPSATRADADGNLWIRTTNPAASRGGLTYDVINDRGFMFDRVQLPSGYQLVGFGPGKLVFLSNRDATGLHLSRVRLK